ncbi:MAG: SPOR domain-containing protein, partial [Tabrizicola sp.]
MPRHGATDVMTSAKVQRSVNLAGAVTSLALVIGLGFWGYQLAVRDVNGVPVIQAMDGPMRISPDDPGGEIADNQGLAVNTVVAVGIAAPPPEKLLLAPRPVELE